MNLKSLLVTLGLCAASLTAMAVQLPGPWHLVVDATGALTIDGHGPEKRLQELDAERLLHSLQLELVSLTTPWPAAGLRA